jgi:endonuclease/exonuclease/phosphatase (EEP) superfamily protein YafD
MTNKETPTFSTRAEQLAAHMESIAAKKLAKENDPQAAFNARMDAAHDAKRAAKRAANALAEANPIARNAQTQTQTTESASEAQINYLTSLLPAYYAVQLEDGITSTELFTATGEVEMTAIRALSKREASAWITEAKEVIA